ncbi:MAG: FAD-dependent oxidoreductase [Bauldia sp.]|nr:FAD-dependent oxidoreductase [Bauldia sp.]MCW5716940.1 FAD-dependent oxidoreductase [Bauldia sp.]
MTKTVAVIGGGVAGLTAAHELRERGFKVTVWEKRRVLGGKARSFPSEKATVAGLPAEHGFRFFPSFYQHLNDTLSRIPGRHGSVLADLVPVPEAILSRIGSSPFRVPTRSPRGISEALGMIRKMFSNPGLGLTATEIAFATTKLVAALSMSDERRLHELEDMPWAKYMEADMMSPAYRAVIVDGLTQNFVAMDADHSSTKTVINILARLLRDFWSEDGMDRILNGPTSDVWIQPWVDYLSRDEPERGRRKVLFNCGCAAGTINYDPVTKSVVSVDWIVSERDCEMPMQEPGGGLIEADYFVFALPVEVMAGVLEKNQEIVGQHPALKPVLDNCIDPEIGLKVSWMSGLILYLREEVPTLANHAAFLDSSWALTSIAQTRHWQASLKKYALKDSAVREVLSVIISNFHAGGDDAAKHADSAEEIKVEALRQLQDHIAGRPNLDDSLIDFQLDPDLDFTPGRAELLGQLVSPAAFVEQFLDDDPRLVRIAGNAAPLFINTVGSWKLRPRTNVGIKNAFLAADYVRTNADLATMEGANEAGRRAVNAILALAAPDRRPCSVWSYPEPSVFAPARSIDRWLFQRNFPSPGSIPAGVVRRFAARRNNRRKPGP